MTLPQESSYLVTLEKNRFPSGSTVSREELIVFKAPFVLWRMVNDHFLYSEEWKRIIFCTLKNGGESLAYSQIIFFP